MKGQLMQRSPATKKRLLVLLLPLILVVALLALLISRDQARPYKTITVAETRLYPPKTFLMESKTNVLGMLRDYIGNYETNTFQFSAYSDDILNGTLVLNEDVASASVIWTVGPLKAGIPPATTENSTYGPDDSIMIPADTAFYAGTGAFAGRTFIKDNATGLFKLEQKNSDGRNYGFTNTDPNGQTTAGPNSWLARCIELSSIRPGGSWGRCTHQFNAGTLLVQIHFDGRLVEYTADVRAAIAALVSQWRTKPKDT